MPDTKLISYLAELSKINMSEEELTKVSAQMTEIINLMDSIKDFQIDSSLEDKTSGVEFCNLRDDIVHPSFERKEVLKNSDKALDGFFTVPKIME